MKRPWIAGWELTTNEKGVEMATLPAQMLRDTLAYIENIEKQCNIANVVGQSEQLVCPYCGSKRIGQDHEGCWCRHCKREFKAN